MNIDKLEEFRNNFFKMVEEKKIKDEYELKRVRKNCFHKYNIVTPYSSAYSIASCERCKHAKFVKN
jgi:hypothetical protein